jgi:5-methylcytosine-specific restriction endonuclease McrA
MRRLRTLELPYFRHGYSSRKVFFVCDCDHPVWSMAREVFCSALSRMQRYQHRWRRIQLLKDADGRHTQEEMERIVIAQRERCIYCNVRFSERVRPSKDHIVPQTFGGTNYASNLVAACRSCNSRRGNTPFFTYCRLLSLSQYRRTVALLRRRLKAVDFAEISDDEIAALHVGLTYDDPKDGRYVYILETQRRRKPVALLSSNPNKDIRKGARQLFYGKKSIIRGVVDEAFRKALSRSQF